MENVKVKEFINDVAAKTASPGGGATAAVTASMAVATLLMAIKFSDNNTLTAKNAKMFVLTIEELETVKDDFQNLVKKEEENFINLMNAFKMSKETLKERKVREAKVQEGLIKASEVPIQLIHEIRRVQ